ncbi:MAG: hypothetical protein AcusKO_48840 [Acuticoccus sp.]
MNLGAAIGVGAGAFLLALGGVLWLGFGPVIYSAITEFGVLICG